ncbi:MAG: hypothetical protein P4L53_18865 [Candidatus Obscuribacterales bacterium]|nr:hypothetical protein [Candidatus Obscuribacterales bacterium]
MLKVLCLLVLPVTSFCFAQACEAKLGEPFGVFQARIITNYKFQAHSKKEDRDYYMYSMITDADTDIAAPGFGGGLTITVSSGLIVGQSMLLRIGNNAQAGKSLAALHTFDFAFESLGRPTPPSQTAIEQELRSYTNAVSKALAGAPQNIRYPGGGGKITIAKRSDGALAIAATPE